MFKVNDSHEIVGNLYKSAQKTVSSSFGRKKRTDPSRVRVHELGSVFHHFISERYFRSSYAAGMFASSVPFVAESVDLVGELGEVLVGAALVVLDDPQQALACAEQPLEDGGRTGCTLADAVLDAGAGAFLQADSTLGPDGPLLAVVGRTGSGPACSRPDSPRRGWCTPSARGCA